MPSADLTPAMQQYYDIKRNYPDAVLLFRMGDFYETFGEDAKLVSRELNLTLTSRPRSSTGERIPLAGVPYHACDSYVARLIRKGFRVAVCEQMEDPRLAKGIVKREVVRVLSPGTVVEAHLLDEKMNNYAAAVVRERGAWGFACADISTGEMLATQFDGSEAGEALLSEVARVRPAEVLLPPALSGDERFTGAVAARHRTALRTLGDGHFEPGAAESLLLRHFGAASAAGLGLAEWPCAARAAGALLAYLLENQKAGLPHLRTLRPYSVGTSMRLDPTTVRNLELVESIRDRSRRGTLIEVLDRTVTPMGSRLLRRHLLQPLLDAAEINRRLDAVAALHQAGMPRMSLVEALKKVGDLERLCARAATRAASPRDLIGLAASLRAVPDIMRHASEAGEPLAPFAAGLEPLPELAELIEKGIAPDPPWRVGDGGVIRDGYDPELDALRAVMRDGRGWVERLEASERQRTGIKSLKVGYNQVFGYYIEVTKPNLHLVPQGYIRKQTTAGGERFFTPELKEKEAAILGADEKAVALETALFGGILRKVAERAGAVQAVAAAVARLDLLSALAEAAQANNYVRPEVNDGDTILIKEGRHPVVERGGTGPFVPNDALLDCGENRLIILTGPNMAGKSTYMRQVALIALLAQAGSFVPASYASIGVVDRIFTRVGAFDDLSGGQSTFMVEMLEVAHILRSATARSLIILDEIGRGTSTFDGMSIAWAVAEYVADRRRIGARTLFATHYHQMTGLADSIEGVRNYHVAVKEERGEITFLRRVVPGATDRSYGVHVAALAGLPQPLVERAREVLREIEAEGIPAIEEGAVKGRGARAKGPRAPRYTQVLLSEGPGMDEHPVVKDLKGIDTDHITPMQALALLAELVRKAKG